MVTDAISSPPPSKRVTPVIMWIKWQNLATPARPLARRLPRGIALQKPNRRTPRARFAGGRGFRRHLLSRCSVRAEVRDGENQRAGEMWSLESEGRIGLMEDFWFYACGGEGESQPRNSGDGDTKRR